MTPDERTLLTRFLGELTNARAGQRDPEAADMIARALAANPDGGYVLVQHTILADQSLHAAQARIAELENQLRSLSAPAPQASGSFFAAPAPSPWAQGQGQVQGQGQGPGGWQQPQSTVPQGYEPMPVQQRPGIFSANSGLGSFLRNAGTTAAGVAGGEMLFSGIRDLFGGGRSGFGGGGFGGGGGNEEIVNNYYDDDGGQGFDSGDQGFDSGDGNF